MRTKRENFTPNMLKGGAIGSGAAAPSVDLRGHTRCHALLNLGSGTGVYVQTQITPDGFDVPDASATWFNYFLAEKAHAAGSYQAHQSVHITGPTALPMPQSEDGYADIANQNNRCGRRMRIATTSETSGTLDRCTYCYSTDIQGSVRTKVTRNMVLAEATFTSTGESGWASEAFDVSNASAIQVYHYSNYENIIGGSATGFAYVVQVATSLISDVWYTVGNQYPAGSIGSGAQEARYQAALHPQYAYSEGSLSFPYARLAQVGSITTSVIPPGGLDFQFKIEVLKARP